MLGQRVNNKCFKRLKDGVNVLVGVDSLTADLAVEFVQFLTVRVVVHQLGQHALDGVLGVGLQPVPDLLCARRVVQQVVLVAGQLLAKQNEPSYSETGNLLAMNPASREASAWSRVRGKPYRTQPRVTQSS